MKKHFILLIALCIISSLCSCEIGSSDEHNEEYYDGYDQGYADRKREESIVLSDIADDLNDFYALIAELMYDREYNTVKMLYSYNFNCVEDALEREFGVRDIDTVIEYIESLSKTVTGICEICGMPVYADDIALLPDGIECAHYECVSSNRDGDNSYRIDKDE